MWEEKQNEIGLILVLTVFCSIGLFARKWLFGYDSYAFVSFTRGFVPSFGWHPAADFIFSFIPPITVIYQIILFLTFFVALIGLYFALKELFKEKSFLILLAGAAVSPILIFSFAQFQNETFGYVFVFWSFYFWVKGKNWHALLIGLLGAPFWLGSLVWVGVIGLSMGLPFIILDCVVFFTWLSQISGALFNSSGEIAYNTWFWGLFDLFLLFPFIFAVFYDKKSRFLLPTLACVVLTIFSARFDILLMLFGLIGLGYWYENIVKWFGSLKIVVGLCFLLILCFNIALFMQHPQDNEMNLTQTFINECKDKNCYNDWSFGWWITALGGNPSNKAGPPSPDYNSLTRPFNALTAQTLFECNLIDSQGILKYYKCN